MRTFIKSIFYVLLLPIRLLIKIFKIVISRLKFSISFKLTVSFVLSYIFVMLLISVFSSIGYFYFILGDYINNTVKNDYSRLSNYLNNIEDINNSNYYSKINLVNDNIKSINIYDSYYRKKYISNKIFDNKCTNNILVKVENIIKNGIFIYYCSISTNNDVVYVNIYYDICFLLKQTFIIFCLVIASGVIGIVFYYPIVLKTSNKLIKPVKSMTKIAKTISVNNINTRLDIDDVQDELKELSETFNEMMDRIENGYNSQKRFVSDASHELRTPIAVIKGYVNMLDRWGKNDKSVLEESILAIKNESDNMQDLIEKLLFIARNDKNTISYKKEDFDINSLLDEIKKETILIDKNHRFKFNYSNKVYIYADRNRIKQSIRIFIDNAIKFTPEGGEITINGFLTGDYYSLKIIDSGIGISNKDLPKIFNRLYRTEESRNKSIGGHGLGLSIAKIIILGHKGKIKVKSKLNEGSEFVILLPYII